MIRPVRLVRVAAQAEVLVVRRQVAGIVNRAILAAVAAVFALAVLILVHVIAYMALRQFARLDPIIAASIVLAADAVIAVIFGVMASGTPKDPILEEARRMRDQSLEQARQSLTLAAMVAPVTRLVADTGLLRLAMRSLRRPARE